MKKAGFSDLPFRVCDRMLFSTCARPGTLPDGRLALRFDEPVISPFAAAKVANSSGSAKSAKKLIFADDGFQPLHIGRRIRAACRAVPQGG